MSNLEEKFQLFLREARSSESTQNESANPARNPLPKPETKGEIKKTFWWLKGAAKTDTSPPEVPANEVDLKQTAISTQSSVSSSMAEFLQREGICTDANTISKAVEENQDSADKLPSVRAESSATKADYSDDFTDDDISSIMDQLSQLAGSGGDDSGRSLGDILKEAEEVVRISSKNQIGDKGSGYAKRTLPSPLLKPESHLIINLAEKSDADYSDDSEGVYVRRERIVPGTNSGASKMLDAIKMPCEGNIANHADEIFKQIELEVKNKIAASKEKQAMSQIIFGNNVAAAGPSKISLNSDVKKGINPADASNIEPTSSGDSVKLAEKPKSSFSPLRGEPLSIVIEESVSETSSSLEAEQTAENSKQAQKSLSIQSCQGKKIKESNSQQLEVELAKEKQANEKLKAEMNSEVEDLKKQIELLKSRSQEKRFALEKDVSILKATLAGFEKKATPHVETGSGDFKRSTSASNQRLKLLEDEMQKQEQLIVVYQSENVKLCQDIKQLKQELKAKESQLDGNLLPLSARRITVAEASEKEILTQKLKGKDVHISQLEARIGALQSEKNNIEESIDDFKSNNVQLLNEIEKHKKVINNLKSRDNSQSLTILQKELDTQKADSARKATEIDRLHRDLRRTSDELESCKQAMKAANLESKKKTDMLDEKLRELQMELDEERAFSEEDRVKHSKDEQKLEELTRQLKDMEQLLKKNRPSPIPPLALPRSSEGDARRMADTPRVKFLEDRIRQLEEELESAKNVLDSGFEGIQVQYKTLKDKYDVNTEHLTNELDAWKKEAAAWKEAAKQSNVEVDVNKQLKEYAATQRVAKPHLFANAIAVKEDAHLIATIRGLKNEMLAKDRSIRALDKKLSESLKTNKRLQTEREKVLAHPVVVKAAAKGTKRVTEETKEVRLELQPYLERHKELEHTISQLKDKIRIKDDQMELFTIELREASERRLRDLEELQEEHDEEIAQLMSENSSKNFHNRYSELEGKVHNQEQIIERLKEQLKALDEHRAENLVLKVEREHLEKNLKEANKKLSLLRQSQSPDQSHYEALLDKIADLELRHESREQNLQAVVRDLLRTKGDTGDSSTLREQLTQKNRELCYYKSEMNKIIGKVTYLENELVGQAPMSNSGRK